MDQFEAVSRTAELIDIDEETMTRLLDEDGLGVRKEEGLFEGLVRWLLGRKGLWCQVAAGP